MHPLNNTFPDESGNFNVILANSDGTNNLIYFITNYGEANGDMGVSGNNPLLIQPQVLLL